MPIDTSQHKHHLTDQTTILKTWYRYFPFEHRQGLKIIFLVSMSEYNFQFKWHYASYTEVVALGMSKLRKCLGSPT